jgi:peptidoglycan/LPS O-acetylase OafA/YrhL
MGKARLLGIELFRGISTYSVILVHSGDETWHLPISAAAIEFRHHFYFAVPFFLAAAFYFMVANPKIGYSLKFWRSRVERILIPYAVWSIIFFISRIAVFTLTHKLDRLQELLQDPLAIVFFGSASYHLYFLPLLLAGTILVLLSPYIMNEKIGRPILLFLIGLSIFIYSLLEASGNAFQLGLDIAFKSQLDSWQINAENYSLLRLILVELSWFIKCLPYFFIAIAVRRLPQYSNLIHTRLAMIGWATAFIVCDTLGESFLPGTLREILLAFTMLLFSLFISDSFKNKTLNNLTANVGTCSFGIYLIHPFVMNFVKFLMSKIQNELVSSISVESVLVLSILCFLGSWLVVDFFYRNRRLSKYLFGI